MHYWFGGNAGSLLKQVPAYPSVRLLKVKEVVMAPARWPTRSYMFAVAN